MVFDRAESPARDRERKVMAQRTLTTMQKAVRAAAGDKAFQVDLAKGKHLFTCTIDVLSDKMLAELAVFGLKKKIQNSVAGIKDVEKIKSKSAEQWTCLTQGKFNPKRAGGATRTRTVQPLDVHETAAFIEEQGFDIPVSKMMAFDDVQAWLKANYKGRASFKKIQAEGIKRAAAIMKIRATQGATKM